MDLRRLAAIMLPIMAVLAVWGTSAPPPSPDPGPLPLRLLAQARGIPLGAAAQARLVEGDPQYAALLAREFSLLTPENELKFDWTHPAPDSYNFRDADLLLNFAQRHSMQVHGHVLVWRRALPGWVTGRQMARDEAIAVLRQHITTVMGRYRGRIPTWDVVNEAIADTGGMRNSYWLRAIGPDYLDVAFRLAHQADPAAALFYNDYDADGLGRKSDEVYALVSGLVRRGVPVHGVGLQMHLRLHDAPLPQEVWANMRRLAALGLQVRVTEMDVRTLDAPGGPAERMAAQAGLYGRMLAACLLAGPCTGFTLWGFTDQHTWVTQELGRHDAPLIFDGAYQPKPAYRSLAERLRPRLPESGAPRR